MKEIMSIRSFALSGVMVLALASTAQAQYDDNPDAGGAPENTVAGLGVRISQLQEQIRALEGKIEQVSFENKQLKEQIDRTNGDTQYRLQALEKGKPSSPSPVTSTQASPPDAGMPDTSQLQPVEPADTNTAVAEDHPTAPPAQTFATARDLYTHALGLVNHANYEQGGAEFTQFTHSYPHDPLIGNAYYWLGETQYVRRDYPTAANSFRLGYESMPTGPKASENLLKLAMSLDAMKKDKEACVVLKQVVAKFGTASVKPRAESELNRIGCN